MARNFKILVPALIAVLVMCAAGASTASAAHFKSASTNTTLTGGQTTPHKFKVNTGEVICSTASFSGFQAAATAETISIVPAYSGCEFASIFEVSVAVNGCDYLFHASSTTAGTVDITTCGTNKYIQFGSTLTCRVRVGEQSGVGTINYAQEGLKVLVTANVAGLTYTESGLFCANTGGSNGTYTGSTLVTGESEEKEVKIHVE